MSPDVSIILSLLALGIIFVAPIVAIALADREMTLERGPYAIRITIILCVLILLGAAKLIVEFDLSILEFFTWAMITVFCVLLSVYRAQDIGVSRWWNLLFLIPIAGICWLIYLLAKEGEGESPDSL